EKHATDRAASRGDPQIPRPFASKHVRRIAEGRREALGRELRILRQDPFGRGPAGGQFQQELDTQARATNAGLSVEDLWVDNDEVLSHLACPCRTILRRVRVTTNL